MTDYEKISLMLLFHIARTLNTQTHVFDRQRSQNDLYEILKYAHGFAPDAVRMLDDSFE